MHSQIITKKFTLFLYINKIKVGNTRHQLIYKFAFG
jgi:hypothetical protein